MLRLVRFYITVSLLFILSLTTVRLPEERDIKSTAGPQVISTTIPPALDIPILMYHKVDNIAYSKYWVSDGLFARQMAALKAYGFQTISLTDFLDYRTGKATLPEHPIIITFDDGYQDFYTHAVPILKSQGMLATIFLPTGKIGANEKDRQNNAWDTKEAVYPTHHLIWDEVKAFVKDGFQVGSHSVTHADLASIPDSQIRQELARSRSDIQGRLGRQIEIFSYPGGSGVDIQSVLSALQKAGYRAAVTTYNGFANTAASDNYRLPRMMISELNSVVLDKTRPNSFFMRKVDPNFPIPIISIKNVEFLGLEGEPMAVASPGDLILMKFTIKRRGADLPVHITTKVLCGSDHSIAPFFSQTLHIEHLDRKAKTYNFYILIPSDIVPGQVYYDITIEDQYAVLEFASSGWKNAFLAKY